MTAVRERVIPTIGSKVNLMLLFLLILAVIAAVYGLGMVASIIGYFFLFVGLGITFLFAVIVVAALLASSGSR